MRSLHRYAQLCLALFGSAEAFLSHHNAHSFAQKGMLKMSSSESQPGSQNLAQLGQTSDIPERPTVVVKLAVDKNGAVDDLSSKPSRFSSDESLDAAHRLRRACDAIMVGIGTVIRDDPSLTVRRVEPIPPPEQNLDTTYRITDVAARVSRGESMDSGDGLFAKAIPVEVSQMGSISLTGDFASNSDDIGGTTDALSALSQVRKERLREKELKERARRLSSQPLRVVLDKGCRIPIESQVVQDGGETMVMYGYSSDGMAGMRALDLIFNVIGKPFIAEDMVSRVPGLVKFDGLGLDSTKNPDVPVPMSIVLGHLRKQKDIQSVLVEGGPTVIKALLDYSAALIKLGDQQEEAEKEAAPASAPARAPEVAAGAAAGAGDREAGGSAAADGPSRRAGAVYGRGVGAIDYLLLVRCGGVEFTSDPVPSGINESHLLKAGLKKVGERRSADMGANGESGSGSSGGSGGGDTWEYWMRDGLVWPTGDIAQWP